MSTNDNLNAWLTLLSPETNTKLQALMNRIQQARTMFGCTIYPPQTDILNALRRTNPDTLKAVIVGQDPYHEEGQAFFCTQWRTASSIIAKYPTRTPKRYSMP